MRVSAPAITKGVSEASQSMCRRLKGTGIPSPNAAVVSEVHAAIPIMPKAGVTGIFLLGLELRLPVHSPTKLTEYERS